MAKPFRPRFDDYAQPIPPLVEVPSDSVRHTATNREAMECVERMLAEVYDRLLRRGRYAKISVTFDIKDGTIMHDTLRHATEEQWRE